jgi:hypothetical protein
MRTKRDRTGQKPSEQIKKWLRDNKNDFAKHSLACFLFLNSKKCCAVVNDAGSPLHARMSFMKNLLGRTGVVMQVASTSDGYTVFTYRCHGYVMVQNFTKAWRASGGHKEMVLHDDTEPFTRV